MSLDCSNHKIFHAHCTFIPINVRCTLWKTKAFRNLQKQLTLRFSDFPTKRTTLLTISDIFLKFHSILFFQSENSVGFGGYAWLCCAALALHDNCISWTAVSLVDCLIGFTIKPQKWPLHLQANWPPSPPLPPIPFFTKAAKRPLYSSIRRKRRITMSRTFLVSVSPVCRYTEDFFLINFAVLSPYI